MTRASRMSALLLPLLGTLAFAAAPKEGATPRDFVRQWPASAQDEGAYAVELSEELYRTAVQPDLSDVAAFNAQGQALAFGPMPAAFVPPAGTWREARWFFLPRTPAAAGQDLHLLVRRSRSGELTLDASVARGRAGGTGRDVLIDVQAEKQQVDALAFEFAPDAAAFSAEVGVEASDDLRQWRTVASGAPVALLRQGDQTLVRRHVDLEPGEAKYLRVRVGSEGPALPLRALQLRLRAPGEVPQPQWLEAAYVRRDGRAFVYRLPARIPATQLDLRLGADNAVATYQVSSRELDTQPWKPRGSLTAFRLRGAGLDLVNEPLPVFLGREREWRVESNTPTAQPPVLRFAYVPERWLLLTHGRAPYVVAAGSERAHRDDYPLDALVSQVRAKYGAAWQPPRVALGASQAAGGEEALRPELKSSARTWALWAVLLLGAGLVIFMVLRLLGSPPPPARG